LFFADRRPDFAEPNPRTKKAPASRRFLRLNRTIG